MACGAHGHIQPPLMREDQVQGYRTPTPPPCSVGDPSALTWSSTLPPVAARKLVLLVCAATKRNLLVGAALGSSFKKSNVWARGRWRKSRVCSLTSDFSEPGSGAGTARLWLLCRSGCRRSAGAATRVSVTEAALRFPLRCLLGQATSSRVKCSAEYG